MNLYTDTSALMRRYLQRKGGVEVDQEFAAATRIGTVAITQVEVACALLRLARGGAIKQKAAQQAILQLDADLEAMDLLPSDSSATARARALGTKHLLKGYDAVHLAAATIWQTALGETVVLATFDDELWAAAQSEGLPVWPPDLSLFK